MTNISDTELSPRSQIFEIAILIVLTFSVLFCIGVVVGFVRAATNHGPTLPDVVIGSIVLLIAALCTWQLIARTQRLIRSLKQQVGPSVRKTRNLWAFFIGTGLVVGMVIPIFEKETKNHNRGFSYFFSDAPIGPNLAIALLIGMVVLTVATVIYYRTIDEHEFVSQSFASLIAINVYVIATMAWWIATKGGLAADIQHGPIFAAVITSWIAVWLWRRYR